MKKSTGVGLLWLAAVILLGGLAIQLWPQDESHGMVHPKKLADILPAALGSSLGRDQEIAATDEMKKAVGELLNYDAAVFRTYQLPEYRVSVYAAWWRPGKMSPRLIAAHTPDVCWPANGWERDNAADSKLAALAGEFAAVGFAPAEFRAFKLRGISEYVVFWHKVGDAIQSYHNGYAPPWWAVFDEIRRNGLQIRKEQLFVRVSSDKPLEQIWHRPEMASLNQALLEIGLRAPQGIPEKIARR